MKTLTLCRFSWAFALELGGTHIIRRWKAGCGVIFACLALSVALSAQTFTLLLSFDGGNGSDPHYGQLIQGINGELYGMTGGGGTSGCGTVFNMTTAPRVDYAPQFCQRRRRL